MTVDPRAFIQSITLENFRKFERLHVAFDPSLTVLVAQNGCGKTAILDAIAIALHPFVDTLGAKSAQSGIARNDVRRVQRGNSIEHAVPTKIQGTAQLSAKFVNWERALGSVEGNTTSANAQDLMGEASALRAQLQDYVNRASEVDPMLPTIAYYGTARLWSEQRLTESRKDIAADLLYRTGAYADCLEPNSSFPMFRIWFERVVREAQKENSGGSKSPHQPNELLLAVQNAIDTVLKPSQWHTIDYDFLTDEIVCEHPEHGKLPVSMLSDGIRNLVAMVGDIAHRTVRLNPQFGATACLEAPGIVLIDEIDMHLHPGWQQTIVANLRAAFPKMQFIVTTHSPLVVTTVPSSSVRLVRDSEQVDEPSMQVEGFESELALGVVFGVSSTPPGQVSARWHDLLARIEQGLAGPLEENDDFLALAKHFGSAHPAILRLRSAERMTAFRARIAAAQKEGAA